MTGERVLIVDDDRIHRKLGQITLAEAGCEVRSAQTAAEALAVLAEFRPRLMLLDIRLPDQDGLELARRLKADPATKDIMIVALTAYSRAEAEARVVAAGCDGFLSKPIDLETVTAMLTRGAAVTNRAAGVTADITDRLEAVRRRHGPAVADDMLRLFGATVAETLPALRRAANQRDAPGLAMLAHRLAGACATLGARTPRDTCRALETMGNRGSIVGAMELVERLGQELDRLL